MNTNKIHINIANLNEYELSLLVFRARIAIKPQFINDQYETSNIRIKYRNSDDCFCTKM